MKMQARYSLASLLNDHALKRKLLDHAASILFILLIFIVLLSIGIDRERTEREKQHEVVEMMTTLKTIDFSNPLQKSLFRETMALYYPAANARNDSVMQAIEAYRTEEFTNKVYKTGGTPSGMSWRSAAHLSGMYLNFILVYLIALIVSYYAAQTLALYRFIQYKQRRSSFLVLAVQQFQQGVHSASALLHGAGYLLKACVEGGASLVLFAPAYIIVYSLKSTVTTGDWLLMIVLAVISNGLLIDYAHKFYTFLLAESKKGYVEAAVVKGLNHSYSWNTPDGIAHRSLLRWNKKFSSHVLQHIYMNARYQYIPTMKQYASFLITGLIIIEMALNIQGHLCYELLQDILFYRYEEALAIIFGIFLVVKGTEIAVDIRFAYESEQYENRA